MSLALLFWVLMILALLFGLWRDWPGGPKVFGMTILVFILLAILGWSEFGAAIHK